MDFFNLPNLESQNTFFFANGSSWQVWNKPVNCKFVYIFAIGGGGGGGGGRTSALTTATGGGGGGSSSITKGLFPANMLPDRVYIQVGNGGAGGVGSGVGSAGELSYISLALNFTNLNILIQSGSEGAGGGGAHQPAAQLGQRRQMAILIQSGSEGAGGGGAGGTSVRGTGGVGGTVWSNNSFVFGNLGLITTDVGQAGANGGVQTADGDSLTPTRICTGGAGGGGVSSGTAGASHLGGNITGSGFLSSIIGGINDATDGTKNGNNGYQSLNSLATSYDTPMFFTGGAGGGSCNTSGRVGGAGGFGSYGSGGGGGGGSYNATGGAGGNGGDGLVLITCW